MMKFSRIATLVVATVAVLGGVNAPAFAGTDVDQVATSTTTTSTTATTAVTAITEPGTTDTDPDPTLPDGDGTSGQETFAHISCNLAAPHLGQIGTHANGLLYPANIRLHVERILTKGTKLAAEWENFPFTTGSGSWSVSTDYYSTMLHGTYKLEVRVYRDSNEKFLGSDSATCDY